MQTHVVFIPNRPMLSPSERSRTGRFIQPQEIVSVLLLTLSHLLDQRAGGVLRVCYGLASVAGSPAVYSCFAFPILFCVNTITRSAAACATTTLQLPQHRAEQHEITTTHHRHDAHVTQLLPTMWNIRARTNATIYTHVVCMYIRIVILYIVHERDKQTIMHWHSIRSTCIMHYIQPKRMPLVCHFPSLKFPPADPFSPSLCRR